MTTTNLARLRDQLRGASQRAIRREHPEFNRLYLEAIGGAETRDDFARASDAIAGIDTPKFAPWRRLLLSTLDLEFAILRLETAHGMLAVLPREEVSRQLQITRGRWSDYTYAAWLFAAQAMLERADRLATRAYRFLIKRHPTGVAVDEVSLRGQIKAHIAAVEELRNAEAHGGGSIDVFAEKRRIDEWAVLGAWPVVEEIVERYPSTVYERQVDMAHDMTRRYFVAVEALASDILRSVEWRVLR